MATNDVKRDVGYMVQFLKKYDCSNPTVAKKLIKWGETNHIFVSSYGERFTSKLNAISEGYGDSGRCVLCNSDGCDGKILCDACAIKYKVIEDSEQEIVKEEEKVPNSEKNEESTSDTENTFESNSNEETVEEPKEKKSMLQTVGLIFATTMIIADLLILPYLIAKGISSFVIGYFLINLVSLIFSSYVVILFRKNEKKIKKVIKTIIATLFLVGGVLLVCLCFVDSEAGRTASTNYEDNSNIADIPDSEISSETEDYYVIDSRVVSKTQKKCEKNKKDAAYYIAAGEDIAYKLCSKSEFQYSEINKNLYGNGNRKDKSIPTMMIDDGIVKYISINKYSKKYTMYGLKIGATEEEAYRILKKNGCVEVEKNIYDQWCNFGVEKGNTNNVISLNYKNGKISSMFIYVNNYITSPEERAMEAKKTVNNKATGKIQKVSFEDTAGGRVYHGLENDKYDTSNYIGKEQDVIFSQFGEKEFTEGRVGYLDNDGRADRSTPYLYSDKRNGIVCGGSINVQSNEYTFLGLYIGMKKDEYDEAINRLDLPRNEGTPFSYGDGKCYLSVVFKTENEGEEYVARLREILLTYYPNSKDNKEFGIEPQRIEDMDILGDNNYATVYDSKMLEESKPTNLPSYMQGMDPEDFTPETFSGAVDENGVFDASRLQ